MSQEIAKKAAAIFAAGRIENGQRVGLGTGTTASYFIEELAKRHREGLSLLCVATSLASQELAEKLHLPLTTLDACPELDVTVDGADEIDPKFRLIKGGGGALFREKIVAASSKKMVVIADKSKYVKQLGAFPLPIEISSFGAISTLKRLEDKGFKGALRNTLSDNGNPLFDLTPQPIRDPELLFHRLKEIPGVIEVGLFLGIAREVILGDESGIATNIPCR